jgi:hypothetical protein
MAKDMKTPIKIILFFLIVLIIVLINKKKRYEGYALLVQEKMKQLSDFHSQSEIVVKCDSIKIMVISNPTTLKLQYDTVIEQTLDEEDFIIIEFQKGRHKLQRIEADDLNYQNINFESLKFKKNDTIQIERCDCDDHFKSYLCHVNIKLK